ncbi:FecR family protein [Filimonas effusa]|uniref:FecR family protein n=1 Tax=Filimonas effusa TaxID=2508721 RepID=UPI0013E9144F|nr:FecR family protein [Filimonas effusa]
MHRIFIRYINDGCDEAEVKLLLDYFKLDENEDLLKKYILEELEQGEWDGDLPVDLDNHLHAVYAQVSTHIKPVSKPFVKKLYFRLAAAAIIILALVSVYLFTAQPAKNNETANRAASILPGRNQAVLTMADGRTIALNDAINGQLASENGITVKKTADGQIIYETAADNTATGKTTYNTIQTPAGGQWQVVLPDRTHVWLNASSSISYPVSFVGKERLVKLSGEAYFEVSSNKTLPFVVESGNQLVEVLGTSFNIMAYSNEQQITTTLFNGAVNVKAAGKKQQLAPGEQVLNKLNGIELVKGADLEEVIAWKNGYFKFNSGIEEIMNKIARWYNVRIIYENKPDPSQKFEGEISRWRNLNEILHIMEYTGKVHFKVQENTIIVNK